MPKLSIKEREERQRKYLSKIPYRLTFWTDFNYALLDRVMYRRKSGRGDNHSVSECFIMADTETSKSDYEENNHVCAWSMAIRVYDYNLVTLWGRKPSEFISCLKKMLKYLTADETIIYWHNLAYDIIFLRKFLFEAFEYPDKQLNTKSHYPVEIKWTAHRITFRDSLILSQCKLETWAKNLDVEHKKAVGCWDYDKIRNQNEHFTEDELRYIEYDVLAGVECLSALQKYINKPIYAMPYTCTGILRNDIKELGEENNAHEKFKSFCLDYNQYIKMTKVYHGGYTHGNRFLIGDILEDVQCFDFASSYPFNALVQKFPCARFVEIDNVDTDFIIQNSEDYAFMFKLIMIRPTLRDYHLAMPVLQFSKAEKIINPVLDNGRVLCCDYIEIYTNEIDLQIIKDQYKAEGVIITECESARKDFLPRWFTDRIFELFQAKTKLKGANDPVNYSMSKSKINSMYGMCVQKSLREEIEEDYATGEFFTKDQEDPEGAYKKYLNKRTSVLNYAWGVWITSYALFNLYRLGACVDTNNGGFWAYSDTDSCYGHNWDLKKVEEFNTDCIRLLKRNGYDGVFHNGRMYYPGVAETEGLKDQYSEYIVLGAKRYCGRCKEDNELHITVSGVPKSGAKTLNNDIRNFRKGHVFEGVTTGKKTHTYLYVDKIYIDKHGNEVGDSIDLTPCDYLLDEIKIEEMFMEELAIITSERID